MCSSLNNPFPLRVLSFCHFWPSCSPCWLPGLQRTAENDDDDDHWWWRFPPLPSVCTRFFYRFLHSTVFLFVCLFDFFSLILDNHFCKLPFLQHKRRGTTTMIYIRNAIIRRGIGSLKQRRFKDWLTLWGLSFKCYYTVFFFLNVLNYINCLWVYIMKSTGVIVLFTSHKTDMYYHVK